jgi:hypothetical protein
MPAALADNDVTVYLVLDAVNAGLFRSAGNSKRTIRHIISELAKRLSRAVRGEAPIRVGYGCTRTMHIMQLPPAAG